MNIPGFSQLSNGRVRVCWLSWIPLLVFCWNIGRLAWDWEEWIRDVEYL